MLYSLK